MPIVLRADRMHVSDADGVRAVSEAAQERLERVPPLEATASPEVLGALVDPTVAAAGIGRERALKMWNEVLGPACLTVDHPRYLAFIPSAPTKAASAFDMLVGASSVYGGSWLEGAGAVVAEHLELLVDPELSVLVFARTGWVDADYQEWSDRLRREQYAFITPTRHHGRLCARIAVINPTTTIEDLQGIFDTMR